MAPFPAPRENPAASPKNVESVKRRGNGMERREALVSKAEEGIGLWICRGRLSKAGSEVAMSCGGGGSLIELSAVGPAGENGHILA